MSRPANLPPRAPTFPRFLREGRPALHSQIVGILAILLAAAVATAPLVTRGASCGHDFDFHLVSWMDAQNAWQHGLLYPHWSPSSNFGAGEPRFVFYPPLTWMLGALLGLLLTWTLVPAALTFLLLAGTGLATRALARQALGEAPSVLAGVLALSCGYTLFTAYERTAYGELAGGVCIPLLLLFALRPVKGRSALAAALTLAAAWLCNAPLGVMASYLLVFVALVAALSSRSWKPLLRAALAAALGLALSAFYLVPAAWEQRWVDIQQATGDPGERIENSFLFAHHADPALAMHDSVLQRVSLIGAGMLAAALMAILLFLWRFISSRNAGPSTTLRSAQDDNVLTHPDSGNPTLDNSGRPTFVAFKKKMFLRLGWASGNRRNMSVNWWLPLVLLPFLILLLQLPVSLPIWNLLPKLRFLQFPWRWFLVLEAPMALLIVAALWPAKNRWTRWLLGALCASWCIGAAAYANHAFYQPCDEEDNPAAMAAVSRTGAGFLGTDEYAPLGADQTLAAANLPAACLAADPAIALGVAPAATGDETPTPQWNPAQHSCEPVGEWSGSPEDRRLSATLPHSGFLILRLRRYPAWRVQLNGQTLTSQPQREDGLIVLPVAQGPVSLAVDWTTTPDFWIGRSLSLLGVLSLTALWLFERRRSRSRLS